METWFREVGRPALFDALAGACDRIDNELDAGIKSYIEENARLSAELENLRSRVSDIDRLKEENRSLQRELQDLKSVSHAEVSTVDQFKHRDVPNDFRSPLAPRSVNQVSNSKRSTESGKSNLDGLKFSELREEHSKLGRNYAKLHEKYSELEGAHGKLNGRLRDMTKAYNGWMEHANKLNELCQKRSRTIKKLEAKLEAAAAAASGPLDASFSSDAPVRPRSRQQTVASDAPNDLGLARNNLMTREDPLIWPPTDNGDTSRESLRSTVSASPIPTGIVDKSRTIEGGDITPGLGSPIKSGYREPYSLPPLPQNQDTNLKEVAIKTEPSSDTPVVVSERCLRKRKHGEEQAEDLRTSTRVKTEDDSDPLITNERRQFVLHESIDFDAEGGRVETPRKRNRTNLAAEDVSGLTSIRVLWSPAEGSDLDGREGQVQVAPRRADSPTRSPSFENTGVEDDTTAKSSELQEIRLQGSRSSMLTPLNRNTSVRQRQESNPSAGRKEQSSALNVLAGLGEGGDRNGTSKTRTTKKQKAGRLQDLLNTPSPGHEAITPLPSIKAGYVRTSKLNEFQVPERRELPFGKSGLKKVDKSPHTPEAPSNKRASTNISARRVSNERATGSSTGSARPLRERPKSELGVNDFKINPKANEGYTYAFTDVVRNKDERSGLSGCVQEGCCGQTFRLQARAQRSQTGPADFQVLLEKYLGDDAWKLATMTKPEKEELWIEAKMRELANEHGKHRHRFHRAASPVGYWRTDFPNTQEELRDKEEAEKMTRQIVDERYREAMRPGGKWLFRDE
ncbi:SAE2-domain-containing protein [Hypoxylon sp. FL1857]|nr:SAE2-domain-containing protein [Hypoxylon sp. FL1857]